METYLSQSRLKNKHVQFLDFELDCNSGRLKSLQADGADIHLEPLLFRFLLLLISRQGELVEKKEVVKTLWLDKEPSDAALRSMVKKTREALGDNAKNPRYIKTIPNKGYMFLPSVNLIANELPKERTKEHAIAPKRYQFLLPIFASFILFLLSLAWIYSSEEPNEIEESTAPKYHLDILHETLNGSSTNNVSTYYDFERQSLLHFRFLSTENDSQLDIHDVHNMRHYIISYPYKVMDNHLWSNSERAILTMREDKQGFFISQLFDDYRTPKTSLCPNNVVENTKPLGFTHFYDASKTPMVFLYDQGNSAVMGLSCDTKSDTATKAELIVPMTGLNNALSELTISNAHSLTLSGVWLSPNKSTAIALAHQANVNSADNLKQNSYLFSFELDDPSVLSSIPLRLDGIVRTGVWNKSGDRFSFVNDSNRLSSYQLAQNKLVAWFSGKQAIGEVVSDCGKDCFVVSTKRGLSQSVFMENPLVKEANLAQIRVKNLKRVHESLINVKTAGYYVASDDLAGEKIAGDNFDTSEQQSTKIIFRSWNGEDSLVYRFDDKVKLNEFDINASQSLLVGLINQRPFVLDLKSQNFAYLSINVSSLEDIQFVDEQTISYVNNDANGLSGLYHLNLITKQISLQKEDTIYLQKTSLTMGSETIDVDKQANITAEFSVNSDFISFLSFEISIDSNIEVNSASNEVLSAQPQKRSQEQRLRKDFTLTKVSASCHKCWHLRGKHFYQYVDGKLVVTDLQKVLDHKLTAEQQASTDKGTVPKQDESMQDESWQDASTEFALNFDEEAIMFDLSQDQSHLVFVLPQNAHEQIKKMSKLQTIF